MERLKGKTALVVGAVSNHEAAMLLIP